jgi:hypothetical protein
MSYTWHYVVPSFCSSITFVVHTIVARSSKSIIFLLANSATSSNLAFPGTLYRFDEELHIISMYRSPLKERNGRSRSPPAHSRSRSLSYTRKRHSPERSWEKTHKRSSHSRSRSRTPHKRHNKHRYLSSPVLFNAISITVNPMQHVTRPRIYLCFHKKLDLWHLTLFYILAWSSLGVALMKVNIIWIIKGNNKF